MKTKRIKTIILIGLVAFIAIITIQVYWLKQAFDFEERKFSQNIQVALLEVANEINSYYGYTTPHANPVEKISKDYYTVNMRNDFEAKVLELLLINKFKAKNITADFEYAIYDCETDDMLYGSYINLENTNEAKQSSFFPKVKNLVYYFSVRFPGKVSFIYESLKGWVALCIAMIITLFIYLYAIYIILQQQKFAALQKDFINNMTHEFKTPLSSILIAANSLSKDERLNTDERLSNYTRIITEQGNKLNNHLEKILNVAKDDNAPVILNKENISIINIANKAIETIKLKYPVASINIENNATSDVIKADEFHFANLLYNLLDNAAKYCGLNPDIKIKLQNSGSNILLIVEDNGIGIEPQYIKHVFEKFYRAPSNNKTVVSGFGLGLYYVKKICDLHHWKIACTSTPQKGTTVTITINNN